MFALTNHTVRPVLASTTFLVGCSFGYGATFLFYIIFNQSLCKLLCECEDEDVGCVFRMSLDEFSIAPYLCLNDPDLRMFFFFFINVILSCC